jgi:capsule polysaccharide export protein KpsE/RkpR
MTVSVDVGVTDSRPPDLEVRAHQPPRNGSWLLGPDGRPRQRRYVLTAFIGNAIVWSIAIAVILFWPRVYAVDWSLIVPNGDPDARVDLKNVGEAYATMRSTYDSKSLDPRVNYKAILVSSNVLDSAARTVKLQPSQFAEPRIKLIDQSSVMELRVIGPSAEQALARARALDAAFQTRLNELRLDELAQREQAIEQAIRTSRDKLSLAQKDLLMFKVKSEIVTDKQLDEMALASTSLERRRIELGQKVAHDTGTVRSLSSQLGVAPHVAGWTLTLQGDTVFLEHFKQFATATAQLSDYGHKWDEAHPKVRESRGLRDSSAAAMALRARMVLGEVITPTDLDHMAMVLQDRSREQLLRELVTSKASGDAAVAEMREIERQRVQLAARLPKLAGESAQLSELQRRVNFTEAVFTNAIGKTDVGHANIFSSYPMVQTLIKPALPMVANSPRKSYVSAGALVASLLLLVGLSLAWMRAKR